MVLVSLGEKRVEKKGMKLKDVYDLIDSGLGVCK